jgi:hypothetical protein
MTAAENRRRLAEQRARPTPRNGGKKAVEPGLTAAEIVYLRRLRRFPGISAA